MAYVDHTDRDMVRIITVLPTVFRTCFRIKPVIRLKTWLTSGLGLPVLQQLQQMQQQRDEEEDARAAQQQQQQQQPGGAMCGRQLFKSEPGQSQTSSLESRSCREHVGHVHIVRLKKKTETSVVRN